MNQSFFTTLLVGLLALAVLVTTGVALMQVRSVQKLSQLQVQAALINRNRALINSLASEALEYSKRNPAIDPLLQSFNIKPKPGAAQSQAPNKAAQPGQ
jgi:hypothetical protein